MRKLVPFVIAMVCASAGAAGAYELRLLVPDSMSLPGQTALFDVYLDTQGEKNISFFSVSVSYDASFMAYNPGLSSVNDYYPLYAPAIVGAKSTPGFPATWLEPADFPEEPFDWVAGGGIGLLPGFTGQINVDYIVNTGPTGQAQGTATNLYLATIAFDLQGGGYGPLAFGFEGAGNVFAINGDATTIVPNTVIVYTPEPAAALLVGLGLAGLGLIRRRA